MFNLKMLWESTFHHLRWNVWLLAHLPYNSLLNPTNQTTFFFKEIALMDQNFLATPVNSCTILLAFYKKDSVKLP